MLGSFAFPLLDFIQQTPQVPACGLIFIHSSAEEDSSCGPLEKVRGLLPQKHLEDFSWCFVD